MGGVSYNQVIVLSTQWNGSLRGFRRNLGTQKKEGCIQPATAWIV
jgi:hypothetical protein